MGTRADFYVGTGPEAKWLGSVGWDGYEWAEEPGCDLMMASTEADFREAVQEIANKRDDWTAPEQGWPWPWEDSRLTDYVYAFSDGKTQVNPKGPWPNMKHIQNVTLDGRSGLMIFGD